MAFFWFLIALILFVVVISRKKDTTTDEYAQGFWDGYRSFGQELQELLNRNTVDRQALQKLIRIGEGGETNAAPETYAAAPLEPTAPLEPVTAVSVPVTQPVVMQPVLTPQQQAARSLRNLNTILYMASFLLVAAGALFVAANMPDAVKLVGVWLIIIAFYGSGYVLHLTVRRLRPAALAFLGTGMALIPFGGVALAQYTHMGAEWSWLMTSAIGLGAYALAAIRLQSQLVSYLTLASVLSLAGSAAASAQTGLTGVFVVLIIMSLIANFVATLWPRWLPAVFRHPIEVTGQVVTPIVLAASIVLVGRLTVSDYEVISLVALLHYVVAWTQVRLRRSEAIVRVLGSVSALIFVYDFSNDFSIVAFGALLIATLQQVYSLVMIQYGTRRSLEIQWIGSLFIVQLLTFLFWQQSDYAATYNVIGLVLIGLIGLVTSLQNRVIWPAVISLAASIATPYIIAKQLFVPSLPWWIVATVYGVLAVAALVGYSKVRHCSLTVRTFIIVAESLYLFLACVTAMADGHALTALLVYAGAAVLIQATSHLVRRVGVQIIAALLLFMSVTYLASYLAIAGPWRGVFIGGATAVMLWGVTIAYTLRYSLRRVAYSFASAQVALATAGLASFAGDKVVDRYVVVLFAAAIVAALYVRYRVGLTRPAVALTATISYIGYFVLAMVAAFGVSDNWALGVFVGGAALFTVASYIERRYLLQLLVSACVALALGLVTTLLYVPLEWSVLFVAGGTALVHYAAASLHAAFGQVDRQFIMTAVGQVATFLICIGATSRNIQVIRVTLVILLIAAALSFALRWWNRDRSQRYSGLFMVSYVSMYVAGLLLSFQLGLGWPVVAFGLGAAIFWSASYAERTPWLLILGNVLFVAAVIQCWLWAAFDSAWLVIGCSWIIASVFYVGYGIFIGRGDHWREQAMLWSTWIILGLGSMSVLVAQGLSTAVALMLLGLAATLGVEAYRRKSWPLAESAVYLANFAAQRLFASLYPELNSVFYAHWWALIVAMIAVVRRQGVRLRLIIAMSFVSLSSGLYALGQGGGYQLLFLAEHLGLLVIGALRQKTWAIWWGIAASALAILYFLRSYTFLWLGFLGLLLIGIVVWRLMRSNR